MHKRAHTHAEPHSRGSVSGAAAWQESEEGGRGSRHEEGELVFQSLSHTSGRRRLPELERGSHPQRRKAWVAVTPCVTWTGGSHTPVGHTAATKEGGHFPISQNLEKLAEVKNP